MQKTLLSNLLRKNPKAIFIASLGTISYDLKELNLPNKTYLIPGSMGCVMGIGLGYALSSKKKVIVLIGDGSFLMKMGSMATILKYKPKNLETHIFQNNKYLSTGGQDIHFNTVRKYIPKSFKIHTTC